MMHLASQVIQSSALIRAAEEGAAEEEDDIFLLPNMTFVVELIGFALVLFILWKYVVPPVSRAMAERADKLARQMSDTEAATQKLADAKKAYDEAMTEARAETTRLREEARARHKAIVEEAAAAAQAKADETTARAREQLASERQQALDSLQDDIAGMARQLAGRVVGESV